MEDSKIPIYRRGGMSGYEIFANQRFEPPTLPGVPDAVMEMQPREDGRFVNFLALATANFMIHRLWKKLKKAEERIEELERVQELRPHLEDVLYQRLLAEPQAHDIWPLLQSIAALNPQRAA